MDFAWVWQPRKAGTVATKYPSVSCSIRTLNSLDFDFMMNLVNSCQKGQFRNFLQDFRKTHNSIFCLPYERSSKFSIPEKCRIAPENQAQRISPEFPSINPWTTSKSSGSFCTSSTTTLWQSRAPRRPGPRILLTQNFECGILNFLKTEDSRSATSAVPSV